MERWYEQWFDADYHRVYAHRDEAEAALAVGTVLALAPDLARGPVLDLGCGAGRHVEALGAVNPLAFGIDLSAHSLEEAPPQVRPRLLRADMRHLPVRGGSLAGICLWFTAFGYFDDDANATLLRNLCTLLRPGGALVLDFLNAPRVRAELVAEDVLELEDLHIHSRRSIEDGRLVKRMRLEKTGSGEVREAVESVRLYEPRELAELAHACGFGLEHLLGNYAGTPWTDAAPRWLGLLRKV